MLPEVQEKNTTWLWRPLDGEPTALRIWLWWEKRRIPYNALVVVTTITSFTLYTIFILNSGHLGPGEDFIEPIAILAGVIFGPIIWNLGYSLGPIVDLILHAFGKKLIVRCL